MTRLYLAAGVAALAIAMPATAGPGGHNGGRDRQASQTTQRGGGGAARAMAPRAQQRTVRQATAQQRPQRAARTQMRAKMQAARPQIARPQRTARVQPQAQRKQMQAQRTARVQPQVQRKQMQANRAQAQQPRVANRVNRMQDRQVARQQIQANQANRGQKMQDRMVARGARQDARLTRQMAVQHNVAARQQLQGIRQMPVRQRVAALQNMRGDRFARIASAPRMQILAPAAATALVGVPIASAASVASFNPFPQSVQYLYPSSPNYYYQYGNGYGYQVDRGTNLISALIPLLAGGYMPGSYLPASYMSSYVPDYYGFNNFYPSSYGNSNLCNRYMNGVVYQVDCYTGMVESVMPMYAGGYGVGQMLPSSYSAYNVPTQYRSMYYNSADAGYWYSPGAIYQYDPSSSLITSVAALMTPGFSVGQPLPSGYGMYNVPMAYRSSYYDTPNSWYRYNNGNIYRVDPATQLVSAVVASILT